MSAMPPSSPSSPSSPHPYIILHDLRLNTLVKAGSGSLSLVILDARCFRCLQARTYIACQPFPPATCYMLEYWYVQCFQSLEERNIRQTFEILDWTFFPTLSNAPGTLSVVCVDSTF